MQILKTAWPALFSVLFAGALFPPAHAGAVETGSAGEASEMVTSQESAVESIPELELLDPKEQRLAVYVEERIRAWSPARIPMVDLTGLSQDIAAVTLSETRVWPDDDSGSRTAILLASLAYFEGARFAQYVDDGRCQKWGHNVWKKRPLDEEGRKYRPFGMCDGGFAQSLWQVHAGEAEGLRYNMNSLLDRRFAARVALGIARRSMRATGTLRYYTGEWAGDDPKARDRLQFALREIAAHPMR